MNLTTDKLTAQIQSIRTQALVFLIDTAQHKKRIGVEYVEGQATPIYSAPVTIQCRMITRSGSESENIAAQQREIRQTSFTGLYRMQIPYSLDVSEGDHISYTDNVSGEVQEFEIIFAPVKHKFTGAVIIYLQRQQ